MTLAEKFRNEGRQEALQKSIQQGALEAERTLLKKQLEWRFSSISRELIEIIEKSDITELEDFARKLLDAKNLNDVFINAKLD